MTRIFHRSISLSVALALVALGTSTRAEVTAAGGVGDWAVTDQVRARLISPWAVAPRTSSFELGLEMELEPGWHVYWINGGDAGYPPRLELEDVEAELMFPAPTRYELPGDLVAFGYSEHVVYPVRVEVADGAAAPLERLQLHGELDFVVCESECIPYRVPIALELPVGEVGVESPVQRELLTSWIQRVPIPLESAPVELGLKLDWSPTYQDGAIVDVELAVTPGTLKAGALDLFFETNDQVSLGKPRQVLGPQGPRLAVAVAPRDATVELAPQLELAWVLTGLETSTGALAVGGRSVLATAAGPEVGQGEAEVEGGAGLPVALVTVALVVFVLLGVVFFRSGRTKPQQS